MCTYRYGTFDHTVYGTTKSVISHVKTSVHGYNQPYTLYRNFAFIGLLLLSFLSSLASGIVPIYDLTYDRRKILSDDVKFVAFLGLCFYVFYLYRVYVFVTAPPRARQGEATLLTHPLTLCV